MEMAAPHRSRLQVREERCGWLEPWNFRIEEARAALDQISGAIGARPATVDDRIGEIEKRLQAVLDRPPAE